VSFDRDEEMDEAFKRKESLVAEFLKEVPSHYFEKEFQYLPWPRGRIYFKIVPVQLLRIVLM
jgi:hypothetical protein